MKRFLLIITTIVLSIQVHSQVFVFDSDIEKTQMLIQNPEIPTAQKGGDNDDTETEYADLTNGILFMSLLCATYYIKNYYSKLKKERVLQ